MIVLINLNLCTINEVRSIYSLLFSPHELKILNEYLNIKHAFMTFTNEERGKWVITIFRYTNFTK